MIYEIDNNCVITQEGGEIDPYVLEKYGDNYNDRDKKGTKCKNNKGAISYEKAKKRFESYYDLLNKTDSGRMRGKMFDAKYNKKGRLLLYPGEPCSERYLEEDGPKKYDMWGVDAFPEGEFVKIDTDINVRSHCYNKKLNGEEYPRNLKYGPEITVDHLLNQYGTKGTEEILETDNRLFNQYFKNEKPPQWPKKAKGEKPQYIAKPIITDEESQEFIESIERARDKRAKKKGYAKMTVKHPYRRPREGREEYYIEPAQNLEVSTEELPKIEEIETLNATDIFAQPLYSSNPPENSGIDDFDAFNELEIIYMLELPTLYNNKSRYIYSLPIEDDFIQTHSQNYVEQTFHRFKRELFDMCEKPVYPIARITLKGIEFY